MITYEPGRWSVAFAFQLEGSVLPRAFAWAGPCALTSTILQIYLHRDQELVESMYPGKQAATLLNGFWAILGFLVVFRSQQAYARWCEGATLLQQLRGEWFSAFSTCLTFCNPDPERKEAVDTFQHQLVRMISLLYNCALQQVATMEDPAFELISLHGFDVDSMTYLERADDKVEIVHQWVQKLVVETNKAGTIQAPPPIMARIHTQLSTGNVYVHDARKISEFPVPFPYTQMLTMMLIFHWFLTVFMCAVLLERWYWATILSFSVVCAFWSINYIGAELEMPFGSDENDLPMQGMMRDMNDSLLELLREKSQIVPSFHYSPHLHRLCTRDSIKKNIPRSLTSVLIPPDGTRVETFQTSGSLSAGGHASSESVAASPHASSGSFVTLGSAGISVGGVHHKRTKATFARKDHLSIESRVHEMRGSDVAEHAEPEHGCSSEAFSSSFGSIATHGSAANNCSSTHHNRTKTTFARKDQLAIESKGQAVRGADAAENVTQDRGCSSDVLLTPTQNLFPVVHDKGGSEFATIDEEAGNEATPEVQAPGTQQTCQDTFGFSEDRTLNDRTVSV